MWRNRQRYAGKGLIYSAFVRVMSFLFVLLSGNSSIFSNYLAANARITAIVSVNPIVGIKLLYMQA